MPSALATFDALGRVRDRLRDLGDVDAILLADALAAWMHGAATLDAALGLARGWRDLVQCRAQATALAALQRRLAPASARHFGEKAAELLRRYETTTWPADQRAGRRPDGLQGLLFDYLAAGGPTSAQRLRKILCPIGVAHPLPLAAARRPRGDA